jgi:hypothetical protein
MMSKQDATRVFLPQRGGGGARERVGGGSRIHANSPSVSLRFASLDTSPMLGEETKWAVVLRVGAVKT